MTIAEFEQKHGVRLIPKSKSKFMWLVGLILGKRFMDFWITYRLPFQKATTITYPPKTDDPMKYKSVLEHELVHAKLLEKWYGPVLGALLVSVFPLPILFSGRWFIERSAYLCNILNHGYEVDWVIDTLWDNYLFCWPKSLMKRWFLKKIKEYEGRVKDNA